MPIYPRGQRSSKFRNLPGVALLMVAIGVSSFAGPE
jgi:hypothetical protein